MLPAAISTATGTHGTNAIFLGDRIAPQTMDVANERITANYADRAATDPMSCHALPVGVTRYFVYDGSVLKEVSSSSAQ